MQRIRIPKKLLIFDFFKNTYTYKFFENIIDLSQISTAELFEYRLKKLKKLLLYAENNSIFYRERFAKAGFQASKFESFSDLENIPPLTRNDLQTGWRSIISSEADIKKLSKGSSSGSTGFPVIYYKDKAGSSAGQAAHFFGWSLSGWHFGLKGLHIWGNPTTVNNEWKRRTSKLKAIIFKHHKYPAYKLTEGGMFKQLFKQVNIEKYDFIDGYTNAIYLFADYIRTHKIQLNKKLKMVLTTAENLHDFQRAIIEDHLGPVFDSYGCGEVNSIAYQCNECNLYHIIEPHVFVEFGHAVDELGSRELLITDLDNYAFPLIRYQNGDAAVPYDKLKVQCLYPFDRIMKIAGRQSDIIQFADGGTLSVPSFFGSMLLKKINGIKQYQVEVTSNKNLRVNLVVNDSFNSADAALMNNALKEYLENKINYEVCFVDKIEISASGKYKLLIDRRKNDKANLYATS